MRIEKFSISEVYAITLSFGEAADLKAACDVPEYHLPILTQIANELARLEKEPDTTPDASDEGVEGLLEDFEASADAFDVLLGVDDEDTARDAAGPETTEQLYALTQLKEAHGDAQEVDRVHDRHILYLFEDGTSFYVEIDGYTTERLEPARVSVDSVEEPVKRGRGRPKKLS